MLRRFLMALLVLAGCAPEPARAPAPVKRNPPRVERRVEPSPAVKALLEDDPDLQAGINGDEAKATLEAARDSVPAATVHDDGSAAPASGSSASSEWKRLEAKQREEKEARRRQLQSTIVLAGPDGYYHSAGCENLYRYTMLSDNTLFREYLGRTITLEKAMQDGLSRHAVCNAPSAH